MNKENSNFEDLCDSVLNWAYERNIIKGSSSKDQTLKLVSEVGELADAINKGDEIKIKDGIGDILVCLINLAEQEDTSVKACLAIAYDEIKDRKGIMHNCAFIKESDPLYTSILKKTHDDFGENHD